MEESRFLVLKAADAEGNYSLWMSLGPLTLRVMETPVPVDTRCPPNVGVMLAQRRHYTNIGWMSQACWDTVRITRAYVVLMLGKPSQTVDQIL